MADHKNMPPQSPQNNLFRKLPAAWIIGGGILLFYWLYQSNQPYYHAIIIWLLACGVITILCRDLGKRLQNMEGTEKHLRQELDELENRLTQKTTSLSAKNQQLQKDLAERKSAQDAQRRKLQETERIINDTGIAICVIDNEYMIRYANSALTELFNHNKDELIGDKCFHVWQTPFCGTHRCPLQRIGRGEEKVVEKSFEIKKADGNTCPLAITVTPFRDEDGEWCGIIKAVRRADTNDGRQQTGLPRQAHDLNNVLSAVIGHTELAIQQTEPGTLLNDNLHKSLNAAHRGQGVVAQLSRPTETTKPATTPLSLAALLSEICTQLQEKLPNNIIVHKKIMPGHDMILAEHAQIYATILTLCLQATTAMQKNGGTLELTLKPFSLAEESATLNLPIGEYLLIRIVGSSSPRESKVANGWTQTIPITAMETESSIINGIGGAIHTENSPGEDTVTLIYLPTLPEHTATAPRHEQLPIPGGHEKILFVDDE